MISEKSIQEVKDQADLVTVVRKYVPDLKKKGANYSGCCPFHDEKTGSFAVNEGKGMYKCFGCGAGGADAIKFVMDKENFDFPSAVKYLGNWFNITIEETRQDEETEEQRVTKADFMRINTWAAKKYRSHLVHLVTLPNQHPAVDHLLQVRKFNEDTLSAFQIGFAPDEYRFLTPALLERGMVGPAEELGLVKSTTSNTFDINRNRIMFPIHNERGEVVGFGGRKLDDNNESNPKYINSRQSSVYNKEQELYGLYQAEKHIRRMGFAVLVEGYTDVMSFHQYGAPNTIASCGTAFTDKQAKKLKRYTNHIVLMGDSDSAGEKANLKNVDLLLRNGFKVDICNLPKGEDPDSFARGLEVKEEKAA